MNSLELLLGQLIHEKNVLEFELERIVNNKDIETIVKINNSKKILLELSNVINMINLTTSYLQPRNNNVTENND